MQCVIQTVATLIVGFGGGYATHAFTVRRDKTKRARRFYEYIAVLLARLTGASDSQRVIIRQEAIPDLRGHCAHVANDCRDRDGFVAAVNRFCNMTDQEVGKNRQATLDALSALSKFVE